MTMLQGDDGENVEPKTWRDYSPMVLLRKHPTKVIGSLIIWLAVVLVSIAVGAISGALGTDTSSPTGLIIMYAFGILTTIWLVVNLLFIAVAYYSHDENETPKYGHRVDKNW